MKLYFSPGACSLSPHIVLRETGMKFDLEQVNNQEKKTKSGVDYWSVNGKGQVPVLEFDNGDPSHRRSGDRAVDRRPEPVRGPHSGGRKARALSRSRVAELHHLGAA